MPSYLPRVFPSARRSGAKTCTPAIGGGQHTGAFLGISAGHLHGVSLAGVTHLLPLTVWSWRLDGPSRIDTTHSSFPFSACVSTNHRLLPFFMACKTGPDHHDSDSTARRAHHHEQYQTSPNFSIRPFPRRTRLNRARTTTQPQADAPTIHTHWPSHRYHDRSNITRLLANGETHIHTTHRAIPPHHIRDCSLPDLCVARNAFRIPQGERRRLDCGLPCWDAKAFCFLAWASEGKHCLRWTSGASFLASSTSVQRSVGDCCV